jgi:hypothetical protein
VSNLVVSWAVYAPDQITNITASHSFQIRNSIPGEPSHVDVIQNVIEGGHILDDFLLAQCDSFLFRDRCFLHYHPYRVENMIQPGVFSGCLFLLPRIQVIRQTDSSIARSCNVEAKFQLVFWDGKGQCESQSPIPESAPYVSRRNKMIVEGSQLSCIDNSARKIFCHSFKGLDSCTTSKLDKHSPCFHRGYSSSWIDRDHPFENLCLKSLLGSRVGVNIELQGTLQTEDI